VSDGRLESGQPHLDTLLGGGLPTNAVNLIIGNPGTGKTMLAEQYIFENASPSRPAVYLTTASEPLEKLVRYGQQLDFFHVEEVGRSIFYEDLGFVLQERGLAGAQERIQTVLHERRPGFLVIDSFKALQTYADDALTFRRFVIELVGRLSALPINAFWIGEYSIDEIASAPEFAVADSIISLEARREGPRQVRLLEILKLRGSGFQSGAHAYRLSSSGLRVFPRLADEQLDSRYELASKRLSSGVATLDEMLGGGLWPGSATLVAGPSGSGKTLMGLHFLQAGVAAKERVILASLQENQSQLARVARGFGWSLDQVEVLYRSPVDLYIDEWVYELLDRATARKATRIVIDSLNDLHLAAPDDTRFSEYVYSLVQRCSRRGISLLMTHELTDLFGGSQVSASAISHLTDNLLLLRYGLEGDTVGRSCMVLKTRATSHEQSVRPFSIGPKGLEFAAR
jgi:circadian clock protein KaiC